MALFWFYIVAITCPALPAPSNGTRLGCPGNATMYYNTTCQFSCNNGYIGSGSQVRRCQHNGTWSGQDFTCQIINCTSLMVDPGGPLRMSSCGNHYGSKCNFSCTIGYRLNGSSAVTCVAPGNQHPGVWNNTIPTCEAITCPALPAPSNGTRLGCSGNATMYYNTTCQFSCNNGYIWSGSQVRRCQHNGTWRGQDFTCQIVTCPALPSPSNSVRHGCTGNATKYPYDTVCRFSCIGGYKASGSSARRCQENGLWNGEEFSCEKILCEPVQLAPNIRMIASCTRLPGDACEFACERGYDLIGSDIRRCNGNGSWTGTQPRCGAITCPTLSPPTNGELLGCNTTEMLYDTVCRFSCKEGSEASGSTVRRCTENGTWSGNDLVCTDKFAVTFKFTERQSYCFVNGLVGERRTYS
ncbi:E-selectin-like [Oculina patagonica]